MANNISEHCLCARRGANESPDELNAIRNAITSPSIRGVCLYFHGGLSGENYVRDDLGPTLMDTFFSKLYDPKTQSGLYPIFVIYDADIRNEDTLKEWVRRIADDPDLGGITRRFEKWRDGKINSMAMTGLNDERTFWLHELFENSYKTLSNDDLEAKAANLLTLEDGHDQELIDIAQRWAIEEPELTDSHPNNGLNKELCDFNVNATWHIAKVAIRLAARFAIGSNHEIEPTIVEECLREIPYLKKLAPAHWSAVYDHAAECWIPGKRGHALLTLLTEVKKHNPDFIFNAQSHSAGAIAIGELIAASKTNQWPKLDSVVLVAPAVNQQRYADTYLEYQEQYLKQTVFILREEDEKHDQLAMGIYAASLLYFVSGAAEQTGYGDKMLLIEQHLQSNRPPYSRNWFRGWLQKMNGDPDAATKVWKVRSNSVETIVFKTCPDIGSTHESTKFPAKTPDLAKAVLAALKH